MAVSWKSFIASIKVKKKNPTKVHIRVWYGFKVLVCFRGSTSKMGCMISKINYLTS